MACNLSDLAERTDSPCTDDKRAVSQDEFVLERVQGLTSTSLHSLASNPVTGWVAFPAACVLVLLDPKTNEQKFIESPTLRSISCCTFTDDGRYIAFGETGIKPHIAMWNLREHKECFKFVADATVRAIFFHPHSPILISLSLKEHVIIVWDYVKGMRMACCKLQTMPLSLTMPRVGYNLVVCGHRKITLFDISKVDSKSYETNVFEDRKTVLLGKQSEYTFVDIESGRGKHSRTVYTVTSCGYLCEVKLGDILIDKAIKVDTQTFCVRYSTELLFVGCTAGVVKICDPDNLTVTAAVSLGNLLGPSAIPKVGSKGHIDVRTLVVDENEKIVTCVYADCSMHSWQIGTDGHKIVCSAIEPGAGSNNANGQSFSKFNLLRAFIGCCDNSKISDTPSKYSFTDQNKQPQQFGGRRIVNENRASYQNVNSVRFTPDGKDVICGNEEGEIKVYELATGILRRVIEAHSSQVTCIELMYDDDFQLVCSGGRDRIMFVLNARADFSLVQVLCDHSAAITAISLVNHKGVLTLVSAAADNVILIRRAILGGSLRFTITGEIAQNNCNRSFFVTSDYIALGGKDSQIKVYKADPVFVSKPLKTINCQKLSPTNSGFRAIDIDPSSSFMAVSQANGNISVYHLQTGHPVASLPLQSDITNIHFTPDLKYMISSTSNGCDLVWRLPERMTDFMRAKQEKTYQIETNKEVTYETYMSCVKVCKEEEEDGESDDQHNVDFHPAIKLQPGGQPHNMKNFEQEQQKLHHSHVAQNSSNHNSEFDHTPSIDSMSILEPYDGREFRDRKQDDLRVAHAGNAAGPDRVGGGCSTCGCQSTLSCSSCTRSVSTTTHTSCCSAMPSDSSVSTTDGQSKHGGTKHLRFYCNADHKLYGQVIDETCVKVGPFRESAQPASIRKLTDIHEEKRAVLDHEMFERGGDCNILNKRNSEASSFSAKVKSFEGRSIQKPAEDVKFESKICDLKKRSIFIEDKTTVEECSIGMVNPESNEDGRGDKQAYAINDQSNNDSCNCKDNQETLSFSDDPPQNISQNSDQDFILRTLSNQSRFSRSSKILERAMFYESVMKADLKSSRRATGTSPTRQDKTAVKEAVRSFSQRCDGIPEDAKKKPDVHNIQFTPNSNNVVHKTSPNHWTPLSTPEYSLTSSNITNLVPTSSSTLVDMDVEDPCGDFPSFPMQHDVEPKDKVHSTLESKHQMSNTMFLELDSTQMGGEILSMESNEVLDASAVAANQHDNATERKCITSFNFIADEGPMKTTADPYSDAVPALPNSTLIHCEEAQEKRDESVNSAPRDECSDSGVANEMTHSSLAKNIDSEDTGPGTVLYPLVDPNTSEPSRRNDPDSNEKISVVEQLEREGFVVPEKYRNALRSCMQLSNSQETFATLRVDTNDLELMAFLSQALKRKLVAAGLVGLSHDEIDHLLKSGVPPARMVARQDEADTTVGNDEKSVHISSINALLSSQNATRNDPDTYLLNSTETINTTKGNQAIGDGIKRTVAETGAAVDEIACLGDALVEGAHSKEYRMEAGEMLHAEKSQPVENKKGMYKSFMNKLSNARKRMANRSANRSITETDLDEDLSSETTISGCNFDENWTQLHGTERHHDLVLSNTYVSVKSLDESQIFVDKTQFKKSSKPPRADARDHGGDDKNLEQCETVQIEKNSDTIQVEGNINKARPTTTSHVKQSVLKIKEAGSLETKPVSAEKRFIGDKGNKQNTAARRSPARRIPAVSLSMEVPSMPVSNSAASVSPEGCCPWRDQCLSEGRGLKELENAVTAACSRAAKRDGAAHDRRREQSAGAGVRISEDSHESVHSKTESFFSSLSKEMSAHHSSESDSGVGATRVTQRGEKPLAEIFRDQDEYLRRLKEVRENFERSIQALSAERRSRQAAERKQQHQVTLQ